MVNRSHTIARSSWLMPQPLSWMRMAFSPPELTVTCIVVEPASILQVCTQAKRKKRWTLFACSIYSVGNDRTHCTLHCSDQFSIISFIAFAGLCMTSPAAILFTTASSSFLIFATGPSLSMLALNARQQPANVQRGRVQNSVRGLYPAQIPPCSSKMQGVFCTASQHKCNIIYAFIHCELLPTSLLIYFYPQRKRTRIPLHLTRKLFLHVMQ